MEEILHQLIGSLSHYLQAFIHPRWCRISSINSMMSLSLKGTIRKYHIKKHSKFMNDSLKVQQIEENVCAQNCSPYLTPLSKRLPNQDRSKHKQPKTDLSLQLYTFGQKAGIPN